jgi:hypothetical protein
MFPIDREPEAQASPRALSRGLGMLRLGQVPSEGARECTQWVQAPSSRANLGGLAWENEWSKNRS